MSIWESIRSSALASDLGWVMVHFLWQGAIVALVVGWVWTLLERRSASARTRRCGRRRRRPAAQTPRRSARASSRPRSRPSSNDRNGSAPLSSFAIAWSTETPAWMSAPPVLRGCAQVKNDAVARA